MATSTTGLIVFAKPPRRAKRRLAAELGRPVATRIAAELLRDTLARGRASDLAPRYLYWGGSLEAPMPEAAGYRIARQSGADLGARMHRAFEAVWSECDKALLIGTDCPDLDAAKIARAAAALDTHDASLVPATDGGYVAIGLTRRARPHLTTFFDGIAWGGPQVLDSTRKRFAASGLAPAEFAPLDDLDGAADLARLAPRHPRLAALSRGANS